MDVELRERINGIEGIVFALVANGEVQKLLRLELHPGFNIVSNGALFWIWQQFLGMQLIDLYKLFREKEKHSIEKLLNVANANKLKVDKSLVTRAAELKARYSAQPYEAIRSKFLAHQDRNLPEMDVDLSELDRLVSDTAQWLLDLKAAHNLGQIPGTMEILEDAKDIRESLAEVFKSIEEWDRVKGFLLEKLLTHKKTVGISEIQKLMKL